MLAAERAENERLRQIIKELQRHRFGRRAESLPVDQLLGQEQEERIRRRHQVVVPEHLIGIDGRKEHLGVQGVVAVRGDDLLEEDQER